MITICFCATAFLSAFLLFCLEILFARLVLPLLGGSPAVWNTCTLFYQALLLAGYLYAHLSTSLLGLRRQIALHGALLALSFLFLPVGLAAGGVGSMVENPILVLLRLATASVGLPLFVIAGSSPLLQKWFASTKDPGSKDPYFLFQASNLGSFAALVGYPVLVEPYLKLGQQSAVWSAAYGAMALCAMACAAIIWKAPSRQARPQEGVRGVSWRDRMLWAGLAFVPSSLMLAATAYLSNFISPLPLLWVVPLAIYLLSFVLTFGRKPWALHESMVRVQPMLLLPLALLMMTGTVRPVAVIVLFHLAAFAVTAMVCHGELASRRPPSRQLTEFYLWLAIGGAAGGAFNALVGPLLFKTVAEYPLTLVLACLIRPRKRGARAVDWFDLALPLVLGLATVALPLAAGLCRFRAGAIDLRVLCLPVLACFLFKDRPVRLGLGLGALFLSSLPYSAKAGEVVHIERSFFGVRKIVLDPVKNIHWLSSGNIVHGGQSLDPAEAGEPLVYYTRSGPLGQMFAKLGIAQEKNPVAVVGLGTGCMACYGRPGQDWIFYEIDPAIERIARDPRYFTFLKDCAPRSEVTLGDARLSLQKAPAGSYGWIIVDAFNSDAIPVHLLTREAMRLYLSKLTRHGFLAFHISNHFLDLEPVLASLAKDTGIAALIENDDNAVPTKETGKSASDWVVIAREPADLAPLRRDPRWRELRGSSQTVWSDDYSSLLGIIRWD